MSAKVLRGSRITVVTEGLYRYTETVLTFDLAVRAARRVLPGDAALSHVTNLRLRGLSIGPMLPLHFSTNSRLRTNRPGLELHRRKGRLHPQMWRGVPILGPDRTFVDCGTLLPVKRLVEVGDWLVAQKHTDLLDLRAYVVQSHLDGVLRARDAAAMVREGSESVRESALRMVLRDAGLPEPALNQNITDVGGRFLARGDLSFPPWKVLVEYDGWQHERDALQRQRDHLRREALEAEGWRVIVVTTADMANPMRIAWRVHSALKQRGYAGPAPRFG